MSRRPTPFDLVFAPLEPDLAAIRDEAERHGRDPREPAEFTQVPTAQRLLTRMSPDEAIGQQPEAAAEYLTLLHAAWRFWDAGRPVVPVARDRLAAALDDRPTPPPEVPSGACYLQLPVQWFWARVHAEGPHEPLDGCFVSVAPRGGAHSVVGILGLRAERGGFSQVSVAAGPDELAAAAELARPDRFAPAMEGGTAAGFRSVVSAAELLLLVQLALTVGAD